MASRSLSDLHPTMHILANRWLVACNHIGMEPVITCTRRDGREQDRLFELKKTNAHAGHSYHQYGLAFDFLLMRDGVVLHDGNDPDYRRAGEIGERLGMRWSGRFRSIREAGHLEWSANLRIVDLLAGKRPAEVIV